MPKLWVMEVFSLQTASLADLWAAYSFLKKEIDTQIMDVRMSQDSVERLYEMKRAAIAVNQEISRRINIFIQPPIKA